MITRRESFFDFVFVCIFFLFLVCWNAGQLEVEIVLFIVQSNDKFIQAIWVPVIEHNYRNKKALALLCLYDIPSHLSLTLSSIFLSVWWQFSSIRKKFLFTLSLPPKPFYRFILSMVLSNFKLNQSSSSSRRIKKQLWNVNLSSSNR